jgi:hypothetical protein
VRNIRSRNQAYDSGESRRSPRSRSRSPPRYNNDFRDEYRDRGGSARGGERRRSFSDSRTGPSFPSNRDSMREPIGRGSRDFSPREPPRGPKALIEPPSGPRASSFTGDFRGDFGYRGDFGRGNRGRGGRGRGWRDDSRDRGRESERDYRGPRDDRGPPPFRDDRSRDRDRDRWDRNDNFRGRRPSSPQGRGRSPNYVARESRDTPSSLDVDRARRGSRDGPLSGGSPSSDSLQPFRGFGRGRGNRGRGRGTYYEDYHGRNPSPDPSWGRRTQPSATPPPQVPAFGSTSTNLPAPPSAPRIPTAPAIAQAPPSGPAATLIPNVPVPTAPRSQRSDSKFSRGHTGLATSVAWTNSDTPQKKGPPTQSLHNRSPAQVHSMSPESAPTSLSDKKGGADERKGFETTQNPNDASTSSINPAIDQLTQKRRPIISKHVAKVTTKKPPLVPRDASDDSDADSVDSIGRGDFFEEDITKIEDQISKLPKNPQDDPLDLSKMAALSGLPLPAEDDTDQLKIWEAELHYHKMLRQKKYEKELLDLTPLRPALELDAPYIEPYMNPRTDRQLIAEHSVLLQAAEGSIHHECASEAEKHATPVSGNHEGSSVPKVSNKKRSRPTTPLVTLESSMKPSLHHMSGEPLHLLVPSQMSTPDLDSSTPVADSHTKPFQASESAPIAQLIASSRLPNGQSSMRKPVMEAFGESDNDETSEERQEQLQSVRKMMRTPSISSLPSFTVKKWFEDDDFLKTLEPDPAVEADLRKSLLEKRARKEEEQNAEGKAWAGRYRAYRQWTDVSNDPACVRSREKFAKAKATVAAEAAAIKTSTPTPSAKPEPSRRGRYATEHDLERVLRISEQEANEAKEKEERSTTACAKEATIPAMCWDHDEWQKMAFADTTGLVSFPRSFAVLEYGEPIDNFTQEENEAFENAYISHPKQWGKIAEALPNRDYKACIQHYYLVKHETGLKEKAKKKNSKRKKAPSKGKPKANASITEINRDDGEDGQDEKGGERRRPRRAAAPTWPIPVDSTPAESEAASPAPTPSRKTAATPKVENGNEAPAPKQRKPRAPRDKTSKQAKNSQLLAAAPTPGPRRAETPRAQTPSIQGGPMSANRMSTPYDGAAGLTSSFATSPYMAVDRNPTNLGANFEQMSQTFATQERDSATPIGFDPQDRRNPQHTSSYWSVPEQTDFPDLLRHFGTDWHGIAKHMASKTHIMVYHTVFEDWLVVPADSNRSRCVANILTQVKNYYQRLVDSGKMSAWETIAREADEKRRRGESTGPLPIPTVIPKTRGHPSSGTRMGSASDGLDEMSSAPQNLPLQQASPTQPSIGTRFPALAQAGPVQQTLSQPATPTSLINKRLPSQPPTQHSSQHAQQQARQSRGPSLGFFNADPQRPILQAASSSESISQRSLLVAQEAHIERQQALRIQEREREQAHQHQAMQQQQHQQQSMQRDMLQRDIHRDRQHQMKQEIDVPNLQQFEPYSTTPTHANTSSHARPEVLNVATQPEVRRTAPPQQFQPRGHQAIRSLHTDISSGAREYNSTPSPAISRGPMSAPPASQEQYIPPPQSSVSAGGPLRQPEPAVSKRSTIMSLLNDDEPSEPTRPTPPKRLSDVAAATLQVSHTPPPHPATQSSRYNAHPSHAVSQASQQLPPQMTSHMGQHSQTQGQSQHNYGPQPPQPPMHQHSSSIGLSRSYTPNSFEPRSYAPPPAIQQHGQQAIYSQPTRQPVASQASSIRREASHSELHGIVGGYGRTPIPPQSSSRLKESPYSASPTAPAPQTTRPQVASPLELAPPAERDYYSRQQHFHMQQQTNAASSPQLGPSYHPQVQQAPPNHRHLAFGQTPPHIASPPPQYAAQHPLHRSRQNSFDSGHRFTASTASTAPQSQQGYAQVPQHQSQHTGPPLQMQYQQPPALERFDSRFEQERRLREERMREEEYHQKRFEESRRR